MEDEKIIALMEGYGAGTLSEEDGIAFFQWYSQAGLQEFHRVFAQCRLQAGDLPGSTEMPEHMSVLLEQAIRNHEGSKQPVPMFRRYRLGWAAAIFLLIGAGGYLFYHSRQAGGSQMASSQSSSGDAAPGTTKAVLTLADGRQVTIDSAGAGQLAVQGKTTVQHEQGGVTYTGSGSPAIKKYTEALIYNTLSTGRGEQSPLLTLSDGTKVWLNALSSIRFPVAFTGTTRTVEITGEAFFDIAKNPSRPFHVKAKDMEVDILGTQFNINSYPDEPDTRTTLLEGSVSVAAGTAAPSREPVRGQLLEPGQQARAQGGKISLVSNPDINQAVAWKSGLFDFNHVNLQAVVRQLARWYDIDVKFEGNVSDRYFRGKVTRDLKLSQVIQLLQDVNVKFHIDGKTLIVTP